MKKLIVIVQTSFDGFVAGPRGEFDNFIGDDENLEFVCSVTDEADAALFGRVSYEMVNSYWPTAGQKPDATKNTVKYSDWYNRVLKIVLSRTLPAATTGNTMVIREDIPAEIDKLKQQPGKNILMFGSPMTVRYLLELDLIDGFWLIMHPVIFGQGIPLFGNTGKVVKLDLIATRHLTSGTMAMHYSVSTK